MCDLFASHCEPHRERLSYCLNRNLCSCSLALQLDDDLLIIAKEDTLGRNLQDLVIGAAVSYADIAPRRVGLKRGGKKDESQYEKYCQMQQ